MVPATRWPKTAARISYNQDIQKKTDYDSFGSETSLRTRATHDGGERTLFATTKGMQIQWAEDGKHYAYSQGRPRVRRLDRRHRTPKQIAGAPEAKPGESRTRARPRATPRRSSGSRVVRYSPAGDAVARLES